MTPAEDLALEPAEALDGLREGRLDAVFLLTAVPSRVVADLAGDEGARFLSLGEANYATHCLLRAVDIDSACAEAYYYLGAVSTAQAMYDDALRFFGHALDVNPEHSSADVSRPARPVVDSYVQNFSQDIEVSDRLQAVNSFGVNDEFSLQTADAVKEVAKEMEAWMMLDTFTPTLNSGAVGTATDPTRMRGFIEQMSEGRLAAELNFDPNWFDANAMNTKLDTTSSRKISFPEEWDGVFVMTTK